jgi:hypothetical protein
MAVFLSEKQCCGIAALRLSLFGIFPTINARTASENHHSGVRNSANGINSGGAASLRNFDKYAEGVR